MKPNPPESPETPPIAPAESFQNTLTASQRYTRRLRTRWLNSNAKHLLAGHTITTSARDLPDIQALLPNSPLIHEPLPRNMINVRIIQKEENDT